jgi:protein associated with RNAse G/E
VHDEDEFEEHRQTYNYPAQICELALRTCAQIRTGQVSDAEPYAGVGWRWLERAMAACP